MTEADMVGMPAPLRRVRRAGAIALLASVPTAFFTALFAELFRSLQPLDLQETLNQAQHAPGDALS